MAEFGASTVRKGTETTSDQFGAEGKNARNEETRHRTKNQVGRVDGMGRAHDPPPHFFAWLRPSRYSGPTGEFSAQSEQLFARAFSERDEFLSPIRNPTSPLGSSRYLDCSLNLQGPTEKLFRPPSF